MPRMSPDPERFQLHLSTDGRHGRHHQVPEMRTATLAHVATLADRQRRGRNCAHGVESGRCHFDGATVQRVGVENPVDLLRPLLGSYLRSPVQQSRLAGRNEQRRAVDRQARPRWLRCFVSPRTGATLPRRGPSLPRCPRQRRWDPWCCWPAAGEPGSPRGKTS